MPLSFRPTNQAGEYTNWKIIESKTQTDTLQPWNARDNFDIVGITCN